MKTIPLTQGRVASVSDVDYTYLSRWKWCYMKSGNDGYAVRHVGPRCRQHAVFMHQIVAERMGNCTKVDHMNQDKLDNRRSNLRPASNSQNGANRGRNRNNTSGYKGVSWHVSRRKWRAYIAVGGRQIHLGLWDCKREAAIAYNKAAINHFGVYASLNEV